MYIIHYTTAFPLTLYNLLAHFMPCRQKGRTYSSLQFWVHTWSCSIYTITASLPMHSQDGQQSIEAIPADHR